jgi:hypothetical protein
MKTNLNTRAKQAHGPTARQNNRPSHPRAELSSARGVRLAPLQIHHARGSVPPPRVRFHLARGLDASSSGTPPRSGAERPLERVSISLGGGRHRPILAPPAGAFNDLTPQVCTTTPTRLGITPQRCSTDSLGETIPATVRHCAERPMSAPWHCAAYFCTTNTSSPRRGTAEPSKGDK